jgi:glycosyltransferase involved in cell wall biosynthesis
MIANATKDISIVIPVRDEEGNVFQLYKELKSVLDNINVYFKRLGVERLSRKYRTYSLIFVDDGSTDKTFEILSSIKDKNLRIIKFRKNFGQSAALLAGFEEARGRVILTIDGDLQNDPRDIPRLLAKLEEGYDCVSGFRVKRHDSLPKRMFSRIGNRLRHMLINDQINDSGCTLKAYRRECLEGIELYGEMHRYIVSLISLKGYKIAEIKVLHHKRRRGKTKYGAWRLLKGFMDLFNIWFWQKFAGRPLHLFGGAGLGLFTLGILMGVFVLFQKFQWDTDLSGNFLSSAAIFLMIVGLQLFLSGLMVDIQIKNYYHLKGTKGYEIEKIVKNK